MVFFGIFSSRSDPSYGLPCAFIINFNHFFKKNTVQILGGLNREYVHYLYLRKQRRFKLDWSTHVKNLDKIIYRKYIRNYKSQGDSLTSWQQSQHVQRLSRPYRLDSTDSSSLSSSQRGHRSTDHPVSRGLCYSRHLMFSCTRFETHEIFGPRGWAPGSHRYMTSETSPRRRCVFASALGPCPGSWCWKKKDGLRFGDTIALWRWNTWPVESGQSVA